PERVRQMADWGARFERDTDGARFAVGREGGHSRNRIVHAADRTGWEVERALIEETRGRARLAFLDHVYVVDLAVAMTSSGPRCVGVYALDVASGGIALFRARAVLLATGGLGRVFAHTTNPTIATGDGVAMAWRAGAAVANMEFVQFHPTALHHDQGESFLISEAVRGEGARLRTADGSAFMERYHPLAELAPRDIVARAIHAERTRRGEPCVYLDITHRDEAFLRSRFPTILARCQELGIDMARDWIPVVPAAHYACGGVLTDLDGRTGLAGLYAAGEAACTGVHGANRLASNSLLEAMVFGRRAALAACQEPGAPDASPEALSGFGGGEPDAAELADIHRELAWSMDELVGIVRNDVGLEAAARAVSRAQERVASVERTSRPTMELVEVRNVALVADLIVRCARWRRESRGLHFRTDCPTTDDANWRRDTILHPDGRRNR
ncbi:MAG TPA: FAD-binding protein, partial [Chthonomonadales bacterium]|nr:FAD-binding protein [Chthonomonadales bacterium]